ADPRSFFIRGIDFDESFVVSLATQLNFYTSYYDHVSPYVMIHYPRLQEGSPRLRYIFDKFPETITGRQLDTNLLQLWQAARTGDAARRFLYYYRIIEFASF